MIQICKIILKITIFFSLPIFGITLYNPVNVSTSKGACCLTVYNLLGSDPVWQGESEFVCTLQTTIQVIGNATIEIYGTSIGPSVWCNGFINVSTTENNCNSFPYVGIKLGSNVATNPISFQSGFYNCTGNSSYSVLDNFCRNPPILPNITSTTTTTQLTSSSTSATVSTTTSTSSVPISTANITEGSTLVTNDDFPMWAKIVMSLSAIILGMIGLLVAVIKVVGLMKAKRDDKKGNQSLAMAQLLSAMVGGTVTARNKAYEMIDAAQAKYWSYRPIRVERQKSERTIDLKDKRNYRQVSNSEESLNILYNLEGDKISRKGDVFYSTFHPFTRSISPSIRPDVEKMQKIGKGSFGTIYKATPRSIWPDVDEELVVKDCEGNNDSAFSTARSLALGTKLIDISYVLCPIAFDLSSKMAVMPYANMFRSMDNFTDEEALWFVNSGISQAVSAISAMHSRGVYHGDLNPTNIGLSWTETGRKIIVLDLDNGRTKGTILEEVQIPVKYMTKAILDYKQPPSASFDNFCLLVNTCVIISQLFEAGEDRTSIKFQCKVNWEEAWLTDDSQMNDPLPSVLFNRYSLIDSGIPDCDLLSFAESVKQSNDKLQKDISEFHLYLDVSNSYFRQSDFLHKSKVGWVAKCK